jgi:hypothetical protein
MMPLHGQGLQLANNGELERNTENDKERIDSFVEK